jgi:hypothetical protein
VVGTARHGFCPPAGAPLATLRAPCGLLMWFAPKNPIKINQI